MTKTEKVKNHLLEYKKITSWDAIQLYRATRLSAIIYNLRHKQGMNILSVDKPFQDVNGEKSYFTEYILVEDK